MSCILRKITGLLISVTFLFAPNVHSQDAEESNRFIQVFANQPATLLDLGLAKVRADLLATKWPDGAQFVAADILVSTGTNSISIESSFDAETISPTLCTELWRAAKRTLSHQLSTSQSLSPPLDECLAYSGYFDPLVPTPEISATWYLSRKLRPCEVTLVSVRLTPRVGRERMVCDAPFLADAKAVTVRKFE